jgi:hypothetical protein
LRITQEDELEKVTETISRYKIGIITVLAFAVVAFVHHGWFSA